MGPTGISHSALLRYIYIYKELNEKKIKKYAISNEYIPD